MHRLKAILEDVLMSCEIELAGPEFTACSQGSPYLPSSIAEELFSLELPFGPPNRHLPLNSVVVDMDNAISRSHTVLQLLCLDHKGLVYDIMRTLKDYSIQVFIPLYVRVLHRRVFTYLLNSICLTSQVSYGRFYINSKGKCDVELFTMQSDGSKIIDSNKQNALCSRLRMELTRPLRVAVVSRGPDTELLVANPVELSGRGRPLVFHDITLALKHLNTSIFSVLVHYQTLTSDSITLCSYY